MRRMAATRYFYTDLASPRETRTWSIVQAIVAAASAVPLLFVRFPPFTDLPEHVAAKATFSRLLPGGAATRTTSSH
jgi:hypothetical protein